MPYYHGTHVQKIPSIQKHGLGGIVVEKNFDCEDGVYLSTEPVVCVGMLVDHLLTTGSDGTNPSEVLKSFRVIVIDDSRVNPSKLNQDPNVDVEGCYLYRGVIDITGMPILDVDAILPDALP